VYDHKFEIDIRPVFDSLSQGFLFSATWKGVISMSGFDPDYYNAERRAQKMIEIWKQGRWISS